MSAELLSAEQGAAAADVIIGVPGRDRVRLSVPGGWIFVPAAFTLHSGLALFWLGPGGAVVARGLWFRRFAVHLTPGPVSPGGLRWRRLPRTRVQAVVRHRRRGAWVVRLMLHSADPAVPDRRPGAGSGMLSTWRAGNPSNGGGWPSVVSPWAPYAPRRQRRGYSDEHRRSPHPAS